MREHGARASLGQMISLFFLFHLSVVLLDSPMSHQWTEHLRGWTGRVRRSETNVPLCPSLRLGEEPRWLTLKVSTAAWFWPHRNIYLSNVTKYRSSRPLFTVWDDGWSHFSKHLMKKMCPTQSRMRRQRTVKKSFPQTMLWTTATEKLEYKIFSD